MKNKEEIIQGMFRETTIWKSSGRRFYKGKYWARVYWDLMNPDQPCKGFDIHHINGDKLDDRIENLMRVSHGEHARLHNTGENHYLYGKHPSENTKQKMSESHKGLFSGNKNPMHGKRATNARYILAEYNLYSSIKEASIVYDVTPAIIRRRIINNKPGYFYIT